MQLLVSLDVRRFAGIFDSVLAYVLVVADAID